MSSVKAYIIINLLKCTNLSVHDIFENDFLLVEHRKNLPEQQILVEQRKHSLEQHIFVIITIFHCSLYLNEYSC